MAVIEQGLVGDGFTRSRTSVFVKDIVDGWCAWIGITGNTFMLSPVVGTFSRELTAIRAKALDTIGKKRNREQSDGPPLIMANLEKIAAKDSRCSKNAPWHYSGMPLGEDAAEGLLFCLREHAYPFFQAHISLLSIVEAMKRGMGGMALPNYLPIILIKLRLLDDLSSYVDRRVLSAKDEVQGLEYRKYVDALLKMLC